VDAYRVQDITNTSLSARIRDGSIIARVRHERDVSFEVTDEAVAFSARFNGESTEPP
jgi:stringent starvation protein B